MDRIIVKKKIILLFDLLTGRIDESTKTSLQIGGRMGWKYRNWLLLIVVGGSGSAILEGVTLGSLYFALSALTSGPDVLLEKLPQQVVGYLEPYLSKGSRGDLFLVFTGAAIMAQLVKAMTDYLIGIASVTLSIRMKDFMQDLTVKRIMGLDYPSVMQYPSGSLMTYVNESEKVTAVVDEVVQMFRMLTMLATYIAIILALSIHMAVVTAAVVVIFWLIVNFVLKRIRPLLDIVVDSQIDTGQWTVEYLNYPRAIRIFDGQRYAQRKIKEFRDRWLRTLLKAERIRVFVEPLLEVVTILAAGIILFAGYIVSGENAETFVPKLFVFVGAFLRMRPMLKYINDFRIRIVDLAAYWKKLGLFYRQTEPRTEAATALVARPISSGVSFNRVTFRYSGAEHDSIRDLSLDIPANKTTAIVGRTGSGKSTIVDLVIGLINPTSGRVLVEGADLRSIEGNSWRASIGVVDQEIILLNSTVLDNIRFGNPDVDEEAICEAIRASHAEEFISTLPEGLDTELGARGFRLSGGQKQRIALARAIARRPDILILDEATSALDNISEQLIQKALSELGGIQTMLIVAHRLSTIRHADNIVVIEGGKLVDQGDWSTLLRRNQIFGDLVARMN